MVCDKSGSSYCLIAVRRKTFSVKTFDKNFSILTSYEDKQSRMHIAHFIILVENAHTRAFSDTTFINLELTNVQSRNLALEFKRYKKMVSIENQNNAVMGFSRS
jgi:hypothetical protein